MYLTNDIRQRLIAGPIVCAIVACGSFRSTNDAKNTPDLYDTDDTNDLVNGCADRPIPGCPCQPSTDTPCCDIVAKGYSIRCFGNSDSDTGAWFYWEADCHCTTGQCFDNKVYPICPKE